MSEGVAHEGRAHVDASLLATLEGIRGAMLSGERGASTRLDGLAPEARLSAANLRHAAVLRERLDPVTRRGLRALGLSSLRDAEEHALRSVENVLELVREMRAEAYEARTEDAIDTEGAKRLAHERADALLGRPSGARSTRIMVTLPSSAADEPSLVRELIERGTDIVRINCAHDTQESWGRMIAHVRSAERATGRSCKVFMDLAGPKVRTGALPPGPRVIKFFPRRDGLGRVRRPARALLTSHDPTTVAAPVDAVVPVEGGWAHTLREGDRVRTIDARDKQRTMRVIEVTGDGAIVSCDAACFLTPGNRLERLDGAEEVIDGAVVGAIAAREEGVLLRPGYLLRLTRDPSGGAQGVFDEHGVMRTPPAIPCTLPEAFDHLEAGQLVVFDDGKASGRVARLTEDGALLEIEHARNNGATLKADKGINFPETRIDVPPMTEKDERDLEYVARHADIVGLSFVRGASDVETLQGALRAHASGGATPGVIVKIETRACVDNLVDVLTSLLASPSAGVMIARGDLAVECGWERLAEMQERILWLAGAAHLPVVWATQVLESLAKKGQPTRAEVTDAAESERADCVMLNKGPYIGRAVSMLAEILERTERGTTPELA